jgi:deoxyribodipyrimidine photo-lyase
VAHSFRRHLQKILRPHLEAVPEAEPLAGYGGGLATISQAVSARWRLIGAPDELRWPALRPEDLPESPRATAIPGGSKVAEAALARFVRAGLDRFDEDRNHPDLQGASGLSPWLHFGHLSAHEVVDAVLSHDGWRIEKLAPRPNGQRNGWWGASPAVESFLDEVITWRELGYAWCATHPGEEYAYDSLPDWARTSLAEHAADPRTEQYSLAQLDAAQTRDVVWNAAQRQLRSEGRIHNYLRMLWGKRVIAWSATPQEAFERLIELNNRYALDGRDPNSYSGIGWVFGRFDRAWGPERAIYGKIRYMTSDAAQRKLDMAVYLERWGP